MKSSNKKTSHEKVTDQLIELLETGTIPWRKTWKVSGGIPRNMVSGKQYRGMNILILSARGYSNPNWVSFKQAKELAVEKARKDGLEIVEVKKGKKSIYYLNGELFRGGVRKGEKSTLITFWKLRFVDENNKTVKTKEESAETRFRLMTHNVFNVSQCTGFIVGEEVSNQNDPIESAIEIAENYQDGPEVKHGFDHAATLPPRMLCPCLIRNDSLPQKSTMAPYSMSWFTVLDTNPDSTGTRCKALSTSVLIAMEKKNW